MSRSLSMTKNRLSPCRLTSNVESKLMMWLVSSYSGQWSFFLLPTRFSFLRFDIHTQSLKVKLYPLVCIYFKFGSHYFDSICFDFDTFWIFFYQFHLIALFFSFNFCIRRGSYSFDWYFLIIYFFFFFNFVL